MKKLIDFIKDENGLETSEYAVMGALIILALLTAVTTLSGAIGTAFDDMTTVIGTRSAG